MTRNPPATLEEMIRAIVREELARTQPAPEPDVYLSPAAAAELAGVAPATIRRWVAEQRLPGYHAGRAIRIRRSELEALLASTGTRSRRPAAKLTPEQRARRDFGTRKG